MVAEYNLDGLRDRLREKLEESGVSMRKASLDAGLSESYVQSILSSGTEPTVMRLTKVCNAANISLAYVLFGFEASPETLEIIKLIETDPVRRDGILAILGAQQALDASPSNSQANQEA